MVSFAPVLIITLNRYEHFKNCVDSLSKCAFADETDLFVALDYPANMSHNEGYYKILAYLEDLKGFKSVNIIKRETNYGILQNYFDALDLVLSKYDRLLFSEDDNIFSFDYLNFMNKCLKAYEHDPNVFTVCGYNYPIKVPADYKEEEYAWSGHSAWGFGLWKNKWEKLDWEINEVLPNVYSFTSNPLRLIKYSHVANHYIDSLNTIIRMKRPNGDGYISMYQFQRGMYSIFPAVSRVRNVGHDGSGSHCAVDENSLYESQRIYSGKQNYEIKGKVTPNTQFNKRLRTFFKRDRFTLFKDFMKVFLLKLGIFK